MTELDSKQSQSESFNQMISKIEGIIAEMSSQDVDLDDVLSKTEEGYKLLKSMKEKLEEAKEKIEQLKNDYDPSISTKQ